MQFSIIADGASRKEALPRSCRRAKPPSTAAPAIEEPSSWSWARAALCAGRERHAAPWPQKTVLASSRAGVLAASAALRPTRPTRGVRSRSAPSGGATPAAGPAGTIAGLGRFAQGHDGAFSA
jgi:hypothetical protein